MIKVLMHGCNGKMGQVVSRMVDETEGMELAAGVDRFLGRERCAGRCSDRFFQCGSSR